jgi:hypothetical protein
MVFSGNDEGCAGDGAICRGEKTQRNSRTEERTAGWERAVRELVSTRRTVNKNERLMMHDRTAVDPGNMGFGSI